MEEIWKDIEGYKGSYQVSNLGGYILLIRKELSSGKTQKEITRDFRISQAQVSFIKNNKRRAL